MSSGLDSVVSDLQRCSGLSVTVGEPLARHTSFGVGGPADIFIEPTKALALAAAIRVLRRCGVPYVIMGRGTNLLVTDAGVRGAVISLSRGLTRLEVVGSKIVASAGATIGRVCHVAADAGLAGIEFAAGIPGTVGGALIMNAGANGGCVGGLVDSVVVLDEEGRCDTLSGSDTEWYYRDSSLRQRHMCVVEATFRLTPASPSAIHRRVYETLQRRCQTQPLGARSAGSIFKRPVGDFAGRLLEAAGTKGMRVGGAEVSRKHANFIINTGTATATDVLRLIHLVRRRVYERFGVWLETEVCIVGELPEELVGVALEGGPGESGECVRGADEGGRQSTPQAD